MIEEANSPVVMRGFIRGIEDEEEEPGLWDVL